MWYGVAQESILGHILFNVYVNGLYHFLDQTELTHYGDDTTTLSSDANLAIAFNEAQECLLCFQQ